MAKSHLVVEFVNAAVTDSITFPSVDGAGTSKKFTFPSGMDGPTAAAALVSWWTSNVGLTNYSVTASGSATTILALADGATWNIGYPIIVNSNGSNINIYYNPVPPCDLAISSVVVANDTNASGVGKITVNATSSFTIEYRLNPDGAWQTSNVFSGLNSGNYTVVLRDYNGCFGAANVDIANQACNIRISSFTYTNETGTDLNDGTATIAATSIQTGIVFSLDGGIFQSSGFFTGIAPGVHSIAVRDAALCYTFNNFEILEFVDEVPPIPEECFNPALVIAEAIPYRFVLKHCNELDDLDKLYFESDLCGVYQPCYAQPLKCTDVLTLQLYYLEEEFSTIPKLSVIDMTTKSVLYSLPFIDLGGGYYSIAKNVSELPLICNKTVYLEVKSYLAYNDTEYFTHARSEAIRASNWLDCNILIKYWNDADYEGIKYEGTGYINHLRLEAIFDEENLPQEIEVYTKSNGYIVPLYETIKEVWNIDVSYVPYYLHKIITVALSHQHVSIEGREYVKEEPYTFERVPKYALRRGIGKLSKKTYQSKNLVY